MAEHSSFSLRGDALIGQIMFSILDEATRIEKSGERVYHLELGDPKYPPPKELIDATIAALAARSVGYCSSYGLPRLREAIVTHLLSTHGPVSVNHVMVSPANMLISQTLDVICNPGDRAVVFTPAFPTYFAASRYIGLDLKEVPLSPSDRFHVTRETVDQCMALSPKVVIVNSGNNPTGAVYSKDVLDYLVRQCERSNAWVISDETYAKLSYTGAYHSLINSGYDRAVVISSLSKILSIPGYRIGYVVADPRLVDKLALSTSTLYSCLPPFTQSGAIRGVEMIGHWVKSICAYYQELIGHCVDRINTSSSVCCDTPESAFYLFVDIRKTRMTDMEFARRLLASSRTTVTPGVAFGYPGYVRLAVCGDEQEVMEGVKRLVAFSNNCLDNR